MRYRQQLLIGDAEDAGEAAGTPHLLTLELIRRLYLPIGERTLFRLISSGKFPRAEVRIGGKLRLWRRETIEQWIVTQAESER